LVASGTERPEELAEGGHANFKQRRGKSIRQLAAEVAWKEDGGGSSHEAGKVAELQLPLQDKEAADSPEGAVVSAQTEAAA
jgi:hypothetical protein